MKLKDHKLNTITWQAHTVMVVNQECLNKNCFPNGRKLKPNDIKDCEEIITNCREVLLEHGCINNQLTLFS